MLFRRRKPAGFADRMRATLWPRRGYARAFKYFHKRVMRLTASPHAVAAGLASGVASSWTPFMGFHFFLSFAIAYVVSGDMLAAALGTTFGNPLTFPFIWATTWEIGNVMLGHHAAAAAGEIDLGRLFAGMEIRQLWDPVLKPMLLGAIPPAVVTGLVVYVVTYLSVREFQARRKIRRAGLAHERLRRAIDIASGV